jgi:hypothetical protein
MRKHVNLVTVILLLLAVASFAAMVKFGGGHGQLNGFSSGG